MILFFIVKENYGMQVLRNDGFVLFFILDIFVYASIHIIIIIAQKFIVKKKTFQWENSIF